MEKKKRIEYIDIARGLGIILIVISHSYEGSRLSIFISMFALPMFFFISGFLYNEKHMSQPLNFIKSKVKGLYIPYIGYGLVFLFIHNLFLSAGLYSDAFQYSIKDFFINFLKTLTFGSSEQFMGTMWFITSLFTVTFLFWFFKFLIAKILKRSSDVILGILVFCSFLIGYNTDLPRSISISLVAIAFFYLGYIYKKHESKIPLKLLPALISAVGVYLFSLSTTLVMVSNTYTNPFSLFFSSLLGIYMTFYLSKLIEGNYIGKKLTYIGRVSLDILALHLLSFKVVTIIQILILNKEYHLINSYPTLQNDNGWWIAYVIVGLVLPVTFSKLKTRIKDKIKSANKISDLSVQ